MSAAVHAVAVLDVGKTNVKLLLHDAETGCERVVRAAPNRVLRDGPYPHFDTDAIAALLLDGLAEMTRQPDDALRPPFSDSFSPRLPGGLNVGAQLFWQARTFPEAFARVAHVVTYPQ